VVLLGLNPHNGTTNILRITELDEHIKFNLT